jgi:prepilin-type N-terminal cleavage/methylation domain-containing protein/prepilin-type processing-associated H-X9-DG protein
MTSKHEAFTIVEILVVITIIGILIAMLLPALSSVREAARSVVCRNNLHQIGAALHSYESANGYFPPAYAANPQDWEFPHWSWSSLILPFLDSHPLYDELGVATQLFGPPPGLTPPWPTTQRPLSVYICPSDSGPILNFFKGSHAKSNYRGITGNMPELTADYQQELGRNGVMYMNSFTRSKDITDGPSNTLMIGECSLTAQTPNHVAALWAGMCGTDASDNTTRVSDCMWMISSDPDWCINGLQLQAYGSSHPGGAHFLLADGSVHFLSQNIDGTTLNCLAARNDGHPVNPF